MPESDDLWRSRIRAGNFVPPDGRAGRAGTPTFVGKVTSTGTLAVGSFVKVVPVTVTGTESDGLAGTLTSGTGTVFALPVGPGIPATGDYVICRRVEHRWVFDEPGTTGGSTPTPGFIACCPSNPIPTTLNLAFTFRAGTSGATYDNNYQDTPLSFVTTFPAYAGGGTTTGAYISPLLPLTDSSGNQIYYIVRCSVGTIGLALGLLGPTGFVFGSSACFFFASYACLPFLASGVSMSSPCFLSTGFGATGDNMVLM